MQSRRDKFGSDEHSDALSPTSNRSSTELCSVSMTSSQGRYGFTRSFAPSAPSDRQAQSPSVSPTSTGQLQGYIPGQGLAGAPDLTPTMRFPLHYVERSQTDRPEINQPMSYWTANDGTTQPADVSPPPFAVALTNVLNITLFRELLLPQPLPSPCHGVYDETPGRWGGGIHPMQKDYRKRDKDGGGGGPAAIMLQQCTDNCSCAFNGIQ
ncbi:hypothetical protein PILCRDRAFT_91673 [Piloderma croceum F 1598]|uniref:Uncharacterized protein n=1 Tax=Piloderma croceum (strain F 1598) TaxID=765440 RepID=A0A0C3AQS1_PILCF|nr:hypothetical protein PILCRDRAFT_91673 [Piloderma croceum F 1598]